MMTSLDIDSTSNPYPLPHNASEKSRLDVQHASYKYHPGTNVVAPISRDLATHIIDVGTDSGLWVLEVAKEFPGTRVTGIDLAYPVFEKDELSPKNAALVVSDVTQGIEVPDGTVDLVHSTVCGA
jgi:trans-aconitate methyltransferase